MRKATTVMSIFGLVLWFCLGIYLILFPEQCNKTNIVAIGLLFIFAGIYETMSLLINKSK